MPYGKNANGEQYAECPRCHVIANGREEIEQIFGYRTMEPGKVIPQSHCRRCRIEELHTKE